MKKRITILMAMMLLLGTFMVNHYIKITYHMNIIEYFAGNHQLTQADREYLENHGPIIYGSGNNSPPLYFVDSETEQYKGIVIDYLQALSIELETEILYQPMTWAQALQKLETGETHLCDMYPSEERAKKYLFSDPIYFQRGVILVSGENKDINRAKDLAGRRVGVQKGDYAHEFLESQSDDIHYVFSEHYEESLRRLLEGQVDAIVGDEPVISYLMEEYRIKEAYRIVDEPMYELPSVLGIPKDKPELKRIINKGIFSLNQTDTVSKIQQKWFGISTPIGRDDQVHRMGLFLLTGGALGFMILGTVVIWNLELNRAVHQRTKALQLSEKNLQTIMDGLRYMVVVVNKQLHIVTANQQFHQYFGNRLKDQGVNLKEVIPDLPSSMNGELAPDLQTAEILLKGRDYQINACPIKYGPHMEEATVLIMEDITDRKIHEAQLLQDHKMAAIGQLAAGVAHEIRNPLGLIRNYTFIMQRSKGEKAILEEALHRINDSVEKASKVIDNLLNFYRLTDEATHSVNLKEMIEDVVELNGKLMENHHISCQLILKEIEIETCEESLKHILINLLNNAIDAMPEGGKITIALKEKKDKVQIRVIDKGYGMSEETQEKIFNPFFTTKRRGQGTGLGCYIVYNELVKLKGEIEVTSKEKVGTTVVISLTKAEGDSYEK
ncbi:ATP-binding protein [Tindallia californiensis]|uniref:histidine kinase n=1 Tax=Tindallia californiensis TaxID=159292 RepID=A0A1H3R7R2_9FIRM|nr:transporter substrate-binding domain-containing protein [Tindallia californiensis]SDZ21700.1 polar amino acid transport system substrate-binding protein [Tindallia californiensis]